MRSFIVIFCLWLAGCTTSQETYHPRQSVHPITLTAVSLKNPSLEKEYGAGSAVVIFPGYAITARHVVARSEQLHAYTDTIRTRIDLILPQGKTELTVVKVDEDRDLALVKGNFQCPCATLGPTLISVDTPVITISYPLYGIYGIQILTDGRYQGIYKSHFVTTAEAAPGSSGGGVFIRYGPHYRLVSIVKGIGAAPGDVQTILHHWIVFSTTPDDIYNFLRDSEVSNRLPN